MLQLLSQRDARWKDILLGTSTTTTIGSHGCTITCVSMLADLTPDEVNRRLINVNGYAQTNLIIWSKIHEAIPWLEFEWRGYTYTADDNAKVLDAISKYGGVLVEVDGKPIGGTRHWVLYVGNKKLYDPWDGKEKGTNAYPTVYGYAIIKTTQVSQPTNPTDPDCATERNLNWDCANILSNRLGHTLDAQNDKKIKSAKEGAREVDRIAEAQGLPSTASVDTIVNSINGSKGEAENTRKELKAANEKLEIADKTISSNTTLIANLRTERDDALKQKEILEIEKQGYTTTIDRQKQEIADLKAGIAPEGIIAKIIWLLTS